METDLAGCRGGLQRRDTHLTRNYALALGVKPGLGVGGGR